MEIIKTIASNLVGLSLLCCIGGCQTVVEKGSADFNAASADYARLLAAHYRVVKRKEISIRGMRLGISLYTVTPEYHEDSRSATHDFVVIDVAGLWQRVIALEGLRDLDGPPYVLLSKSKESLLCIEDYSGGNSWNASRFHVFSLSADHFLECAGYVSQIRDVDGDGEDDLVTVDDRWENFAYTCHANAPGCVLFWKVKDGVLTLDTEAHLPYYRAELKRLEGVIGSYPRDKAKDGDQLLLSAILTRAMIHWRIGEAPKGWDEFRKEIRHFDDGFFFVSDGQSGEPETISVVSELESLVRVLYGIPAPVPPPSVEAPVPPGSKTYVVRVGDSYASIAKKFYGDESKWKMIVQANPQLWDSSRGVPNMKEFHAGVTILIPKQP